MSVFSLNVDKTNPVTAEVLGDSLNALGVTLKNDEKDEYQKLLAVFHESVVGIMSLPGESHLRFVLGLTNTVWQTMYRQWMRLDFRGKTFTSLNRPTTSYQRGRGDVELRTSRRKEVFLLERQLLSRTT